jgi:hypothetical protein
LFTFVENYINKLWKTSHITVGIFEVHEITSATMVVQLRDLLIQYELLDKVITYVKDEGADLNSLITTLISIVSCVPL